jgi:putative transposase
VVVPGCPHHVLQHGVRSMNVFSRDQDREEYLRLMAEQARDNGLTFLAYCLMDDHVHLVVVPQTEDALARAIGEAHRRYTRSVNQRQGVRGWLFQGRFFSCPLDPASALSAIRYVERNPVRAQLVRKPWNYRWSSSAYRVRKREYDPLLTDPDFFHKRCDWTQLLSADPQELEALREKTRTGRPCGKASFVAKAEEITGRTLAPQPPGRPHKIIMPVRTKTLRAKLA